MDVYETKVQVELFHLLFLIQLTQKLDKRLYALNGDCNLRFFFQSIRYSEDIDLDVSVIEKETLQSKINRILTSPSFVNILLSRNIKITEISQPKQTSTTQRWKVHLLCLSSGEPLGTKIEFSRRKLGKETLFDGVDALLTQRYHLPPILVNHYTLAAAYIQKIDALVNRMQTQARDAFDLYHLQSIGAVSVVLPEEIRRLLSLAQSKLLSISFEEFKSQVVFYMPQGYQHQYDSEALWEDMVLKMCDVFEKQSCNSS